MGNELNRPINQINSKRLKREKARNENNIKSYLEINKAVGYLQKIKFDVELDAIYKVIDSCSYNSSNFWCPIILKVGEMLRENTNIKQFKKEEFQLKNKLKNFLLQVWDKKGRMIYER